MEYVMDRQTNASFEANDHDVSDDQDEIVGRTINAIPEVPASDRFTCKK